MRESLGGKKERAKVVEKRLIYNDAPVSEVRQKGRFAEMGEKRTVRKRKETFTAGGEKGRKGLGILKLAEDN